MKIQNSFTSDVATLYIVPTPIGNLLEMNPRAIEILKMVDYIACEDTRTTKILLDHFNINTTTIAHHSHNQEASINGILNLLANNCNIALVSDAGYPLISDPGNMLVNAVINSGYYVTSVSGPSATLNALVVSGLVTQPFCFYGFLPTKQKQIIKILENIKNNPMTYIFYISVHDLFNHLNIIYKCLGDCQVALVREMTKKFEQILRGNLSELLEYDITLKGEFVLVLHINNNSNTVDNDSMVLEIKEMIKKDCYKKEIIKYIVDKYKVNKNYVYDIINDLEV